MSASSPDESRRYRLIECQLIPGERIGWVGRPAVMFYVFQDIRGLVWVPLLLSFAGLFLAFTGTPQNSSVSRQHLVVGLTGTGLLLLFILLLLACAYALRTIYAITDRRAIILEPYFAGFGPRVTRSYGYQAMGIIECETLLRSKVGNVIFKRNHMGFRGEFGGRSPGHSIVDQIGFFAVRGACDLADAMSQYIYVK